MITSCAELTARRIRSGWTARIPGTSWPYECDFSTEPWSWSSSPRVASRRCVKHWGQQGYPGTTPSVTLGRRKVLVRLRRSTAAEITLPPIGKSPPTSSEDAVSQDQNRLGCVCPPPFVHRRVPRWWVASYAIRCTTRGGRAIVRVMAVRVLPSRTQHPMDHGPVSEHGERRAKLKHAIRHRKRGSLEVATDFVEHYVDQSTRTTASIAQVTIYVNSLFLSSNTTTTAATNPPLLIS